MQKCSQPLVYTMLSNKQATLYCLRLQSVNKLSEMAEMLSCDLFALNESAMFCIKSSGRPTLVKLMFDHHGMK